MRSSHSALRLIASVLVVASAGLLAVAQETNSGDAAPDPHQLWTFTADEQKAEEDLDRTEGQVIARKTLAWVGLDGHYLPYLEVENRFLRVNDTTTRSTERTYSIDPEGHKSLTQVVREELEDMGGGQVKSVRTISAPNANGKLQMLRRETEEARHPAPGVQESETTVLTSARNGGFASTSRVEGRETRRDEHTVEFRNTTFLPDGRGGWQITEVQEGTIRDQNGMHVIDERTSQPDASGKLVVMKRIVTKDSTAASGAAQHVVETYAPEVSGESNLLLQRRLTTTSWPRSDGSRLEEEQVEERSPSAPAEGLQFARKKTDLMIPGTGTAGRLDDTVSTGNNGIISIDTGKSGNQSVQVDTSHSH